MVSPRSSSPDVPAIAREFDIYRIEREVNAALQAAADGKLVPRPVSLVSMPLPCSLLTEKASQYALDVVDPSVFTHSLRSYYFGTAIAIENFPDLKWDPETFYLASILHDIGCTHAAIRETRVSFEFYGGMLAHNFLITKGATKVVADTVMEAICRHKDLQSSSSGHSPEGQMLMFGAQLDVLGNYSGLINRHTIDDVVTKYPRDNFHNVFADLLLDEVNVKHYCTGVRAVETGLIDQIRNNPIFGDKHTS
eukprot:c21960_g1_i1 orf=644-1396(-)